jgi:hypothetical protein
MNAACITYTAYIDLSFLHAAMSKQQEVPNDRSTVFVKPACMWHYLLFPCVAVALPQQVNMVLAIKPHPACTTP